MACTMAENPVSLRVAVVERLNCIKNLIWIQGILPNVHTSGMFDWRYSEVKKNYANYKNGGVFLRASLHQSLYYAMYSINIQNLISKKLLGLKLAS